MKTEVPIKVLCLSFSILNYQELLLSKELILLERGDPSND